MTKTLSKKNLNWSQITFIGFIVLSVIFSCSRPTIAKGNTDLRSKDVKPKEELFEHHSNLGISYLDQQKYSDAVTEFQKALEIEPKHLPTIVNLGLSYHHQLQFDEAVKTFKRALEIDPNEPYSHYNLGLIYYVKNRFDEAESELKKVVSVDPNDPAARYHLAMVYSKQGRLDEAEKQFRAVIKLYPDSSSAYYGLSRALMDAGKKEEVEEVLKKFQELRNTGRVSSEKDKYLREGKYLEPMIPIEKVPLIKEIAKKSSSVRFVDVTSGAGLKFRHGGSGTIPPESIEAKGHESLSEYTPDYIKSKIVSSLGSGAVLFDYDNDAYLDLYIVNCNSAPPAPRASRQAGNALYHNNGNGTFTDVTAKAGVGNIDMGMGCAVGDYNNDGNPDLYVTSIGKDSSSFLFDQTFSFRKRKSLDGKKILYRNNGDGTFADVTEAAGVGDAGFSAGAAFGDYDADGDLDLYVANYIDFEKTPSVKALRFPYDFFGQSNRLYCNNGNGTFTDVTAEAGVGGNSRTLNVVFTDYDNDRDIDIYVVNDGEPNILYSNNRDGTFTDVTSTVGIGEISGACVAVGDYDNNGNMDFFIAGGQGKSNFLYKNSGTEFMKIDSPFFHNSEF